MFKGRDAQALAWMINRLIRCCVTGLKSKPLYNEQIWRHLSRAGADSLGIVSVIAACAGIILALQSAQQLERVGALSYVAGLVGVTIIRELGPLLTAIIVTGRSGAAFAAEIASMQISDETAALEVMGLDPIRFIVWPKFLAMIIMLPCLTIWADLVGVGAGCIFSSAFLGLHPTGYIENTITFLTYKDVLGGLLKSLGFAVAITVIGCWQGFLAREGAQDVGLRTTSAVVKSIFMIILLDLFFTALNFLFR